MSKLLKEAIADAKAVKTIAIENAKLTLAETFQREVTGMFQNKIKEELATEELKPSGIGSTVGKSHKPKKQAHEKDAGQKFDAHLEENEVEESAPVTEEAPVGDDNITDDELEEILNSLKEEMGEEEHTDPNAPVPPAPAPAPAPVDPAAPVAPAPAPTCVPPAPAVPVVPPAPVDPNSPAPVDPAAPVDPTAQVPQPPPIAEDNLEDIDIDELLKEIELDELEEAKGKNPFAKEDDDEEEAEEEEEEKVSKLKKENMILLKQLEEHIKVVEFLRGEINEINMLNAKLLYTNKLFKQFGLSNSQKANIVEKFDLTNTLREVKLTYTVLADQLNSGASAVKSKSNTAVKSITEGLASKAVASTKPSKDVIVENTNEMALRFKKLAGIEKK